MSGLLHVRQKHVKRHRCGCSFIEPLRFHHADHGRIERMIEAPSMLELSRPMCQLAFEPELFGRLTRQTQDRLDGYPIEVEQACTDEQPTQPYSELERL